MSILPMGHECAKFQRQIQNKQEKQSKPSNLTRRQRRAFSGGQLIHAYINGWIKSDNFPRKEYSKLTSVPDTSYWICFRRLRIKPSISAAWNENDLRSKENWSRLRRAALSFDMKLVLSKSVKSFDWDLGIITSEFPSQWCSGDNDLKLFIHDKMNNVWRWRPVRVIGD